MNETTSHDQDALRAELANSQERLDGLVRELGEIDAELELHAEERLRNDLLHEVCSGLEKLGELDAADLFWRDRASVAEGERHVAQIRHGIDDFQRRLLGIEESRRVVLDKIRGEEDTFAVVEDDLFEAQWREEQKKYEWIPEREVGGVPERPAIMPWMRGGEDEQRLRKSLAAALLLCLFFGFVFPMIDLPIPERWQRDEVPERLASLIQERPLPPPIQEPKPVEREPEPVEEQQLAKEEGTPQPESDRPVEKKKSAPKGLLAFKEKFSGLGGEEALARLGAEARISSAGESTPGRTQRSLVATQAPGSSGGINLAALSRDVGGGGGEFEGVAVARATSSIGGGNGQGDRPLAGGPGSGRTDEEIQIVFDRHKSALYRLYNRELRNNPTLQGQMVLRLTIEPDGSVSFCELQSSDMDAPQLATQVVGRVKTFDFGAKEVPALTILYPIDFLPAT